MDWNVVERSLHNAARPAMFVGFLHLLKAIGQRGSREQVRRTDRSSEELRFERDRNRIVARHRKIRFRSFLDLGLWLLVEPGIDLEGGILAGSHSFDNSGRTIGDVPCIEE